jgi:CRISPR/Cas system-associated endonuclease Cas3-HD
MKNLVPYLKNKYVIAILAFVVWITFFDSNNLIDRVKQAILLHDLKKQKEYYLENIHNDSITLHELKTDTAALEKYAREKYLMKKENEDIFLIIDEKN